MTTKIESIRTDVISVPLAEVVTNHPFLGQRSRLCTCIVRIRTNDGIEGFGQVATESAKQARAITSIIEGLAERLVGMDALRRTAIGDRVWALTSELMHEGISNEVQSAIDIALWDVLGKHTGLPVSELLGARRDTVPVYGSHGLHRNADLRKIESDGAKMVSEGFTSVKLRLLGESIKNDVERVRVLRNAIGPDIKILTDALWSMNSTTVVRLAREIEQFDVLWLEDPMNEDDYAGLARVRAQETVPIASGERISRLSQLEAMIAAQSMDYLILDVQHIGGFSNFQRYASVAEAHFLPVSGHANYELHLPLLSAVKNVGFLEYMTSYHSIYEEPPKFEGGVMHVSKKPGHGLVLNEDAVKRMALAE